MSQKQQTKFGTAPVFFTAISTILGAILFLRFGYAVGNLGFLGVLGIIAVGHLVTIPTALAISELATNEKVKGGGEYYIISRSFGINIGSTIGIALYFSQAISVAFYVIAFTEAFAPVFEWVGQHYGIYLPRQAVSVPAMLLLSLLILTKGADLGVKALYVVVAILFVSLGLFFLGKPIEGFQQSGSLFSGTTLLNPNNFFVVFAIIFPAFTGMTAGVGLSGDLKDPSKSIPLGSIAATVCGMIIYAFIGWKLFVSAPSEALADTNRMIMGEIALFGWIAIPIGLAASTISSALGSIMVAPRTLQALGVDKAFPVRRLNIMVARGKGKSKEPKMATLITCIVALIFVAWGAVDAVAEIISMFFMVTYGSICLISFLYHFSADPSYRPSFKTKWFLSLVGFVLCVFLMFQINAGYAFAAIFIMVVMYIGISYSNQDRKGMQAIFSGTFFQLSRQIQVYLQRADRRNEKWRPSVVCISKNSFERNNIHFLLDWISKRYGFATYIHLIEGYYSNKTYDESVATHKKLVDEYQQMRSNVFVDTLISPSYTSAIAQVIQLPGISGKENNMIVFEHHKEKDSYEEILTNYNLVRAGDMDICVFSTTNEQIKYHHGIHIWISPKDINNTNLMILLSYIIMGHPDWKTGEIKVFHIMNEAESEQEKAEMLDFIKKGRLPISESNIEFLAHDEETSIKDMINEKSADAGLTILGLRNEQVKHLGEAVFTGFDKVNHILFVDAYDEKVI